MINSKTRFTISSLIALIGLIGLVVGCVSESTLANTTPTLTETIAFGSTQVSIAEITKLPTATSTALSSLTHTPTATPVSSLTPVPVSPTRPMPTALPTSLTGHFLTYNAQSISLFYLENGEHDYLMQRSSDVLDWQVSLTPSGNQVVYWQQTATASELWITELEPWMPQLLITLPESNYESVSFDWLSPDRYFVVRLHRTNELGKLARVASYLIDVSQKEIRASASGWEEVCPILAVSPNSGQLATFCLVSSEPPTYLVIETTNETQTVSQPPNEILREIAPGASERWVWSRDFEYVVFPGPEFDDPLYFRPVDRTETILLQDGWTRIYSSVGLSLSPNGEYIAYVGVCPDGIGCTLVMHVPTQEIVWTSESINIIGHTIIVWSPDSRYFLTTNLDRTPLVIDLLTYEVVFESDITIRFEAIWWLMNN